MLRMSSLNDPWCSEKPDNIELSMFQKQAGDFVPKAGERVASTICTTGESVFCLGDMIVVFSEMLLR